MNVDHEVQPEAGRVADLLRRAGVVEEAPPGRVWDGIVAALSQAPGPVGSGGTPSRRAPVPTLRGRRTAPWSLLAAAAAGALVTWLGLDLAGGAGDAQTDARLVASGPLAPLGASALSGTAEVVQVDGGQRLRVELTGQPDAGDGYLEVWLLRPDVSGMVTLGVLAGTSGEFPLPDGVDLGEYPVVDISREHLDGDPGHGGDSLVRGQVG